MRRPWLERMKPQLGQAYARQGDADPVTLASVNAARETAGVRRDWRQAMQLSLVSSDQAQLGLRSPLLEAPPGAVILDMSTVLDITFDGKYYRFWSADAANYQCPDGCRAVAAFWGVCAIYDASDWLVNEPYRYVTFSLCGRNAPVDAAAALDDAYYPYSDVYRPGTIEDVRQNLWLEIGPGQRLVPVAKAAVAGLSGARTLAILFRLLGWQWSESSGAVQS
jgi:hypothetical protein